MEKDQRLEEHIRHFLLQWHYFPFPAMLIRRDRTVLAANPAAERAGLTASIRCCDTADKASHRECLADLAIGEKSAKRLLGYAKEYGAFLDTYWMPLADMEDVFVHFSDDITHVADPALFPEGKNQ